MIHLLALAYHVVEAVIIVSVLLFAIVVSFERGPWA